jgi:hypothetical protein
LGICFWHVRYTSRWGTHGCSFWRGFFCQTSPSWYTFAPRHGQSHHAAGVHPRRPPCAGRRVADGLLPHTGKSLSPGHQRRAGRGQIHLHRGAGPVPDRQGHRVAVLAIDPSSTCRAARYWVTRPAWSTSRCTSRPTSAPAPAAARWAAWPKKRARPCWSARPRVRRGDCRNRGCWPELRPQWPT